MALKAPGIEIREIDKSQYAQAPNPTQVYIVGFAQKGELYKRMVFTSRAAWLNYYGEPVNEAERYFYNACMEVINQGGTLYCARIPYENESKEKYVAKKYKVSSKLETIPEVYQDFLSGDSVAMTDFMDGRFSRFGIGFDAEDAYASGKAGVVEITAKADYIDTINESENKDRLAFDYVYAPTEDIECDTDWVAVRQTSIFDRLIALFTKDSIVRAGTDLDTSDLFKFISGDYEGKTEDDVTPEDWVKAFCYAYAEVFGSDTTSLKPWRFVYDELNVTDKDGNHSALYNFLNKNKSFLDTFLDVSINDPVRATCAALADLTASYDKTPFTSEPVRAVYDSEYTPLGLSESEITDLFEADVATWQKSDLRYGKLTPFIYFDADVCNLMANYTAATGILGLMDLTPTYWTEMNSLIEIATYLSKNDLKDETEVKAFTDFIVEITGAKFTLGYTEDDEDQAKDTLILNCAKIYKLIKRMAENAKFQEVRENLASNTAADTKFAKKCLELYLDSTNVTGTWDLIELRKATNLGVLAGKAIADTDDEGNVYDTADHADTKTYFEKYETVVTFRGVDYPVKSIDDLVDVTARQLSKVELVECMEDIFKYSGFETMAEFCKSSSTYKDLFGDFIGMSADDFDVGVDEPSVDRMLQKMKWSEIREEDPEIKDFYKIDSMTTPMLITQDNVTEYEADETRVPLNSFYVVDRTRGKYGKCKAQSDITRDISGCDFTVSDPDLHSGDDHECIGIVPVITTAANALKAQKVIDATKAGKFQFGLYEALKEVQTLKFTDWVGIATPKTRVKTIDTLIDDLYETSIRFKADDPDENETVSQIAADQFPAISSTDTGLDRENLKKIGVVVFKTYLDASEGNKISFELVESFAGELDRKAINPNTGVTTFIDKIVNSQSEYIYFFSNCFASSVKQAEYRDEADILVIEPQRAASLGLYEDMVKEDISLTKSIYDGLNKSFDKSSNIDECQIDIVVDAGMSNIAQYIYTVYGPSGKGIYDPTSTEASMYKLKNKDSIKTWKTVIMDYFNNFCKNVRKDCMFICDGPRPLSLVGNKKIVRSTKPANTIDANILPYIIYISGLNTNYGAGYAGWFQVTDEFTGDYFWLPPSIKAMGAYCYTDANFFPWFAPAGLNRGIINALDVSFSPSNKQGGEIYEKSWNYAVDYPNDGITLWGQKTLQAKPSALDRVNVRRLMLYLERQVYLVSRYFVFEQHTMYTRQRLLDLLNPIFSFVKSNQGLYDYKLICDDSNNPPEAVDRNELHLTVGVKPTKTIEFIYTDMVILNTGASWSELG